MNPLSTRQGLPLVGASSTDGPWRCVALQRQINEQGYQPPPSDGGACGPVAGFDPKHQTDTRCPVTVHLAP